METSIKLNERLTLAYPNNSAPPHVTKVLRGEYQSYAESESALRELGRRSTQANQQAQAISERLRDLTRRREQQGAQATALRAQLAGSSLLTLDGHAVGELLSAAAGYEHLLAALDIAIEPTREAERQARESAANWETLESLGRCRLHKTVPNDNLLQALDAQPGDGLFDAEAWQQIEQQRAEQQREAERRTREQAQAVAQWEREDAERQATLEELATTTDWRRLLEVAFGTQPPSNLQAVFLGGYGREAGLSLLHQENTRVARSTSPHVQRALARLCELAASTGTVTPASAVAWG